VSAFAFASVICSVGDMIQPFFYCFKTGVGWMGHVQCANVYRWRCHHQLSFCLSAVTTASSASSSMFIPIRSAAGYESDLTSIASTSSSANKPSSSTNGMLSAFHNLCLARRLGAWCNLPVTTGGRRGYMHGVQRGRLRRRTVFFWGSSREGHAGGASLRGIF